MTLAELYQVFLTCTVVTTDSRHCPENSLFFALKGDSFNGNAYAEQALQKGCSYAVIDEPAYAITGDQRFITVPNCLQALQQLANYHRRVLATPIIGITGTNGKTTTKELIAAVLSQTHHLLYTQGNFNNHIGVPLTLLNLKPQHTLAVIEMGANHPGEIKTLVEIAEPNYGLITNVGKAHLEGFGSFEGVIQTKGELYDYLCKKDDTTVFTHHDNPYLVEMALTRNLSPIYYGSEASLYISGESIQDGPFLTFKWKAETGDRAYHKVRTQLIGAYNLPNALAAVAIGKYFGVESEQIDKALIAYTPQNNRSQLKKTENNTLIIDAYNANPTSMMAALENFRNMDVLNKVVVLGDMRELGDQSKAEHRKIIDYLKKESFAEVILVGPLFAACTDIYKSYTDVQTLITDLVNKKITDSTILIKGSNGIKLDRIVSYL